MSGEQSGQGRGDSTDKQAWKMAEAAGANALYAMGGGRLLSALWKMAEASQTGLTADLRHVPVRQETIEICENSISIPIVCKVKEPC